MIIDLRAMLEPLSVLLMAQLQTFTGQHPDVKVCTIALGADGFHGHVCIGLDTVEHSVAYVSKYSSHLAALGNDVFDAFCDNAWDCAHVLHEIDFPGYPDLYETKEEEIIDYLMPDGTMVQAENDRGDEAKHIIVQAFLGTVIKTLLPFKQLRKSYPFRFGVSMVDGGSEFWVMDQDARIVAQSKKGVTTLDSK